MSGRRVVPLIIAVAALAVGAFVVLGRGIPAPLVIAPLGEAQDTRTDFPLQVEHWSEPRVAALRRQEGLDQVVAGATGEIDRFRRLMHWTRSQFPVGDPEPYPPANGVGLLAEIRSGRTGGFCGQYSYLLADALKSFGH